MRLTKAVDQERTMGVANMKRVMKRNQPTTPEKWLDEIRRAIDDARETAPFAEMTGETITEGELFPLAPLVCMKFRGLDFRDEALRQKVTDGALGELYRQLQSRGRQSSVGIETAVGFRTVLSYLPLRPRSGG